MSTTINLSRVWRLVRLQVLLHGKSVLPYFGIALGVLYLNASTHGEDSYENNSFFQIWYAVFILLGGFIYAASCLPENKTAEGRQTWLTLPASDSEKWLASYVYTGPLFFLVGTIIYWLLSLILRATAGIFHINPGTFNPFTTWVTEWEIVASYFLLVQPLGLLAAIVFNKGAWIQMPGVIIAYIAAIAGLVALTFRLVFYDMFTGFWTPIDGVNLQLREPDILDKDEHQLLLTVVFGLFLLTVSYFRFQEKEV